MASTSHSANKRGVPEGLWIRCDGCEATVLQETSRTASGEFARNAIITSSSRLRNGFASYSTKIASKNGFTELRPCDPLGFVDKKAYKDRLVAEQKRTGLTEACIAGRGYMRGRPLVIALTDSSFIMGSMGSVVGEKLTRSIEHATEQKLPLVIVSGSGRWCPHA